MARREKDYFLPLFDLAQAGRMDGRNYGRGFFSMSGIELVAFLVVSSMVLTIVFTGWS